MNDNNEPQGNPWMKSLLIWAGILLALAAFVSVFDSRTRDVKTDGIAYSDFIAKVDEGTVKEVVRSGDIITGLPPSPAQARQALALVDKLWGQFRTNTNVILSSEATKDLRLPGCWLLALGSWES